MLASSSQLSGECNETQHYRRSRTRRHGHRGHHCARRSADPPAHREECRGKGDIHPAGVRIRHGFGHAEPIVGRPDGGIQEGQDRGLPQERGQDREPGRAHSRLQDAVRGRHADWVRLRLRAVLVRKRARSEGVHRSSLHARRVRREDGSA